MSKKILPTLLIIIVFLMIVLLICYIARVMNNTSTQNERKISNVKKSDLAIMMIELEDAEKELTKLKELADDQKSIAKIEILFERINFYKKELKKPLPEINKEVIDGFYNAGIWQEIVELKDKLEKVNTVN